MLAAATGPPGYQPYCPYRIDPSPAGVLYSPGLAKVERLISASQTRRTPITIWDLGSFQIDDAPAYRYLASLLDH